MTSSSAPSRGRAASLAIVVLLAMVVGLQMMRERAEPLAAGGSTLLYVRSPEVIRRLALSYRSLLADVYWIRAIQHYGDTKRSNDPRKTYALLYPLLDLATSLDPQFDTAYQFGAIFLAEPPPGGPGVPRQAIALLEKGIAAQPEDWRLVQALGFVHYWWYQDFPTASGWFQKASRIPGAPTWLAPLAAATLAEGENRTASRQLWRSVEQNERDEWMRAEANRRLRQLDAMDDLDALRRVAQVYRDRAGRDATTWGELVGAGLLRGAPMDPLGLAYRLTPEGPALDPTSRLLPLPTPRTLP